MTCIPCGQLWPRVDLVSVARFLGVHRPSGTSVEYVPSRQHVSRCCWQNDRSSSRVSLDLTYWLTKHVDRVTLPGHASPSYLREKKGDHEVTTSTSTSTSTSTATSSPSRDIGARLCRVASKITIRITRKGGNVNEEKSEGFTTATLREI